MTLPRRRGFTLIEVMVSVAILSLAATAALKLAIMAQNTLAAVREKETLIDAAREIEVGVLTGDLDERGTSGDIRWDTEERETEMFGEDFGRLSENLGFIDFDHTASADTSPPIRVKWRELTVTYKKERRLTLSLPTQKDRETELKARDSAKSEESKTESGEDQE